jgi:hypothetical protein
MKAQQGARQFAERMKDIAKETTGSDPGFVKLVDRLEVNEFLPIELAKHMHFQLLKHLEISPNSNKAKDLTLDRAITQARREKVLDQEALDLAHTIRRQGNVVRHEPVHRKTYTGRVYFTLLAASLLWPHLPE